ncbi:MAG: hypothetical protein WB767_18070, partial [Nocardioides sp.]
MIRRLICHLYRTLGSRYRWVLVAGEAGSSAGVAVATVAIVATYFDVGVADTVTVVAVTGVATLLAVGYATFRARPAFATIERWRATPMRTPRETVAAWEIATTFTLRQYRRDSFTVSLLAIAPTLAAATVTWNLEPVDVAAMMLASLIPAVYATVLSYSIGELLARPLIEEIAA